jgi:putative PEP-CTERM system histidine kinase
MLVNIGLITYFIASASFTVLGLMLVIFKRANPLGASLLIACAASAGWAAIIALSYLTPAISVTLVQLAELTRNCCWLFVLLQLLALQTDGTLWSIGGWRWRWAALPLLAGALVLILSRPVFAPQPSNQGLNYELILILWLVLALSGLVLIEQLYRNATQNARWSIKYLCLGLGALLVYDFFMYAEALLFRELDFELWEARGLINALALPLLAVGIARNSNWRANLQVSREVAFHSVTLMGAGLYLMGMAAAGYAINYLGGSWGGVLQMGFLAAAVVLLVTVLFSGKMRAHIRVFLSKHFFTYHYDYRAEWLKFTQSLSNLNDDVGEGIIRIMAPLASSPAGLLWVSEEKQAMHLLAHWEMPRPPAGAQLGRLPAWLQRTDWVIDLDEWRRTPDIYEDLELPEWLQRDEQLWLIIPLVFRDHLQAVLMLKKSPLKHSINWEDRDLLKTAGRQAAANLAQNLASKALVEARQFDAFNRLSAYVVHDLKNILAQQSLIVSNAAKHRNNPAFVDDMVSTVENSVSRMQRLMEQMRSGIRSAPTNSVALKELLQEIVDSRAGTIPSVRAEFAAPHPAPDHVTDNGGANDAADTTAHVCFVEADRERLATVFNHLVQNAQEATTNKGEVIVRLCCEPEMARIEIEDNGHGMSAEFIRDRLFRPFESTKGLTGMGIGAFESREYIRQLGGDISVTSTSGEGSTFYVTIPYITTDRGDRDRHDQEPAG